MIARISFCAKNTKLLTIVFYIEFSHPSRLDASGFL